MLQSPDSSVERSSFPSHAHFATDTSNSASFPGVESGPALLVQLPRPAVLVGRRACRDSQTGEVFPVPSDSSKTLVVRGPKGSPDRPL